MTLPLGYRRKCGRCRVDRHDRCTGQLDCGCDDPSHPWNQEEASAMADVETGDDTNASVAEMGGDAELGPGEEETVIIELYTGLYRRLLEAANVQDRDPAVVLRRAIDHYLGCPRPKGCMHAHDERA